MFPLIMGGGCVGLRAFGLLQVLGYRRFIVHGMDFSYRETTHAGPHTGKETQKLKVSSYGREFITSPVHLAYLNQFNDVMKHCGDTDKDPTKLEIVLRGDGLLQHSVISAQVGHRGKMPFKDVA